MPRPNLEFIWDAGKHRNQHSGHSADEKLTVIISTLKNMFTRNDCLHQETPLFFQVESSVGASPKLVHCAPVESKQMASISRVMNHFALSSVWTTAVKTTRNLLRNEWKDCKTWMGEKAWWNFNEVGFPPPPPYHSCLNTVRDIPPAYKLPTFRIRLMQ